MLRRLMAVGGLSSSSTRFRRILILAPIAVALSAFVIGSPVSAIDVQHTADDAAGTSGFAAATNWDSGAAPSAGNNYFVIDHFLRTPESPANLTFAGDALTFSGGRFHLRNSSSAAVITVNNLILDASDVRADSTVGVSGNNGTNPVNAISNLAGTIKVTSNGAMFNALNTAQRYLNIQANITDAPGATGQIALGGNDVTGNTAFTNKRITLSGTNNYSGATTLLGGNVQLSSPGALPATTVVYFGGGNNPNGNGNATLDLNGGTHTVAGIAINGYTALVNQPIGDQSSLAGHNTRTIHMADSVDLSSIKIGQTATAVLSTGAAGATATVIGIRRETNDVIMGFNSGIVNTTANLTGLTFNAATIPAASQVIGNSSTVTDATLSISASTSFAGTIVDSVRSDPAKTDSAGNKKTNINFTGAAGTLTLSGNNTYTGTTNIASANSALVLDYAGAQTFFSPITGAGNLTKVSAGALTLTGASGASTYTGATTVNGGSLVLNFGATGAPASNIINSSTNSSSLNLNGAALTLSGSAAAVNSQRFNGFTLGAGGSTITLTRNTTTPQDLSLDVGSITRGAGGVLFLTNPTGTLSATNGLLTSSGSAGAVVTANGTPYIIVNGTDWGAKDASNQFVTALASYTDSTATTLTGDANVVTDVNLASGGSANSIRFNDATPRTITLGGQLTTGGVLMTSAAGTATITGSSLQTTGAGGDLVLVQNSTANPLIIASNIVDNGTSGLATAGPGTIIVSGTNSYTGKTSIGGGTTQFTKQAGLGGNSGTWTASNIIVNTGATLALNVGGANEFTPGDVGVLSALGTATGGLRTGSALALDTGNAGGPVALTSPIVNTNGGANVIGLKKLGVNTLQLPAGPNNYSGPTTISKGTLQLTGNNSLTGNTAVSIANDATAILDLNGFNTAIGGLSGGGTSGGTVSLGAGNLTVNASANATYAGSFTSTGGALAFNLGTAGSNATTQTLTGAGMTGGNLTVANGTVLLSFPTAGGTTWGSATTSTAIAPANGTNAVLNVGANTNLVSQYIMVGGNPATDAFNNFNNFNGGSGLTTGGPGTLTVSSSTAKVQAQTLYIGTMGRYAAGTTNTVNIGAASPDASPTVELTGTVFPQYGLPGNLGNQDNRSLAITMGTNQNQTAVLNIAGANTQVKIENNSSIIMGRYYATTATINQSGGNVTFYSDAGTTPGGSGALIFDTDNPGGNTQNYRYNLNGGTLTVGQILNANTYSSQGSNNNPNAALFLNGGTLAAPVGSGQISDWITGTAGTGYYAPPAVKVGNNGGTIETNGNIVQINAGIFHDPGANAVDGGLMIKSSTAGGVLILNPSGTNANTAAGAAITANTFTGPVNIVSGTLRPQTIGALAGSSSLVVGPNGIYDATLVASLPNQQTLSGTGHVTGTFAHTTPSSTITAGGVGTAGTLTFDGSLDLAGGRLRADLDQTATQFDKIVVGQSGGFNASGTPGGSVIAIEFMGALPTTLTKFSIVNYSGNFAGPTNNVTFNGMPIVNPTNLSFTSSNPNVVGRNTQLAINNTTQTLDVIYQPGAVAGNLIWTGGTTNSSSVWDTNNTANWNNLASGQNPDKFFIRDAVTFDNSPGVPHIILINESVAPATITVNSDGAANEFTFAGTGKISGGASLIKSGTNTLTVATSNEYTGGTTINTGAVVLLDTASVPGVSSGLGNGPVTVNSGATLQVGNGAIGAGTIVATTITNNGSMVVNRPDPSTVSATITGTGTLGIQGGGTVTIFSGGANASNYTGNTTISGGSTLQPGAANATSINSVIQVENTAGSRFTLNGFNSIIGGLSGGGANSGELAMGGNNLEIAGQGTNNLTYSGPISSFGGTLFMGRVQNVGDEGNPGNNNTVTQRSVALTSKDAVQTLAGESIMLSGPTTVRVGTLNFAPSVPTTIGSSTSAVNITTPNTLPWGYAAGSVNPPSSTPLPPPNAADVTQATLTINANTTLLASTFNMNPGQNSLANFVQNGGTVMVSGNMPLGFAQGGTTVTLNGGNFIAGGTTGLGGETTSIMMGANTTGANPGQNNFNPNRPYMFTTINVNNGATLSLLNSLAMGTFFNMPCTVNQNGGTVQFVADPTTLEPGGTGGWTVQNNNNGNFGAYVWNLNGGVLAMNQATVRITAGDPAGIPNVRPVMNLNGGTLRALSDQPAQMFDSRYLLVSQAKGGTIDTNGRFINFTAPISHDATLGSTPDGGMTIIDSVGGGELTFSVANTYTGPTKIGAGGKLSLNVASAINVASNLHLAGGKLNLNNLGQQLGGLKTLGSSIIDLAVGGVGEVINFADSSTLHWAPGTTATGATLHIANWNGNATNGGGLDQIVFPSLTSLTPNQLSQIVFDGSGFTNAKLIAVAGGAELVPTNTAPAGLLLAGDINKDSHVNAADISALMNALGDVSAYLAQTGFTPGQAITVADMNFDDVINNSDVQSLITYLKNGGGSTAAVPEPAGFVLLGLGGLLLTVRRHCARRMARQVA